MCFITNIFILIDDYTPTKQILQLDKYQLGVYCMDKLNFERIGEKLRTIRLSKNLTQEYIANAVDINTSHISNIENNRVKVSLSTLVQICNALDTTVDYVLSEEYNDSSSAIEQEILHELHACSNETKEQILKIVKALQ